MTCIQYLNYRATTAELYNFSVKISSVQMAISFDLVSFLPSVSEKVNNLLSVGFFVYIIV